MSTQDPNEPVNLDGPKAFLYGNWLATLLVFIVSLGVAQAWDLSLRTAIKNYFDVDENHLGFQIAMGIFYTAMLFLLAFYFYQIPIATTFGL